jgi:S-adenosylmethionine:tRNA ribosyltransferase-isomerase
VTTATVAFTLPAGLEASEPPERRGLARDGVRLLVLDRVAGAIEHARFHQLPDFLSAGDLLVFNSSRTLPAVLEGRLGKYGPRIEIRLAEHLADDSWYALILCRAENSLECDLSEGVRIGLANRLYAVIRTQHPEIPLLWRIRFTESGAKLIDWLYRLGRPVRYEHVREPWGLDYYQTVYACEPGSAEMPSAGRAFTWRMLMELPRRGVKTTRIVLHAGLSSYLDDQVDACHAALEEEYYISNGAASEINEARAQGRRVIAVGTTVVRALESAVGADGRVQPGHRYTRLRVTADHALQAVDGLLTGLHEPEASHLDLLAAFVSPEHIQAAYEEAVARRYLWHEFGDLNLII